MDSQTKSLLARIFPILFFFNFIGPKDPYVNFHCNQALLLCLLALARRLLGYIPFLGFVTNLILGIFMLYCWIVGIISVSRREMRPLPFIGHIHLMD